ncbi:Outer membrane lipoprotein-sorting protein [hydrothermal vent metagenome]|uniref:Outer membrane lipoprotein-sorting protein n=1 Tax=hydrothermal vent metagenome TaxID=652676 RepID=A0A3B1BCC5_9ZZZZ
MKKIVCLLLSLISIAAFAETPEETGLAIAVEVDKRDIGFHNFTAVMTMELKNRQGEKSLRHMKTKVLEMLDDGDKTLIVFNRPRDVKGTALLTYSHKTGQDDQWLYLPALKRVKRISSRNKSGPFMGSEFAYEDLSSQEVEKYSYKYLRDEQLNGQDMFVNELYPVDKNSGYTRQIVWIDKQEYRPQQIVFYDRKNSKLKTLIFSKYKQYLDQYWRAGEMFMENHQTGKTTLLAWDDYKFRVGLKASDFTKNSLKRAK